MSILQGALLFLVAALGGALNSVAGGGSFVTLPTLIATGVPPVNANATSTVALWPASIASVRAYGSPLVVPRRIFVVLVATSIVGGVVGARVLLHTPQKTFLHLLPYLMLVATVLFALGSRISALVRAHAVQRPMPPWLALVGTVALQLPIALYGGFFGGGMSMLILAMLSVFGLTNIHAMNALKNLLASCINGAAVLTFVLARAVMWPQAILMLVGAVAGAYGSTWFIKGVDPAIVRRFVIVLGAGMTVYLFLSYWR
jgi:uncharacterized membrane protein YfcA